MTTTTAVTRSDALRARSVPFRRHVDDALFLLADELDGLDRPYVAFSGGKDSLVALALAARVRPDIAAIWCDDELEYDGVDRFVVDTCHRLGVRLIVVAGWTEHGGWFRPWRDEPAWREPLPRMVLPGMRIEEWAPLFGFDGCVRGVRTDEARHRRLNTAVRGRAYDTAAGMRVIDPLARWSVNDVWAAIAHLDLPYHRLYDALAFGGVARADQRLGPLPLCRRDHLALFDPTLPSRLEERYGHHW